MVVGKSGGRSLKQLLTPHPQEAKRDGCIPKLHSLSPFGKIQDSPTQGMVLPTIKMDLPMPINIIKIILHRHAQRPLLQRILDSVDLKEHQPAQCDEPQVQALPKMTFLSEENPLMSKEVSKNHVYSNSRSVKNTSLASTLDLKSHRVVCDRSFQKVVATQRTIVNFH